MERILNSNDVATKIIEQELEDVEDCNIATEEDPRVIKLAKEVPKEYKKMYLDLLIDYMDFFPWSYQAFKAFETSFIQHKIYLRT